MSRPLPGCEHNSLTLMLFFMEKITPHWYSLPTFQIRDLKAVSSCFKFVLYCSNALSLSHRKIFGKDKRSAV